MQVEASSLFTGCFATAHGSKKHRRGKLQHHRPPCVYLAINGFPAPIPGTGRCIKLACCGSDMTVGRGREKYLKRRVSGTTRLLAIRSLSRWLKAYSL